MVTTSEKILGARIEVATAAQEHELGIVIDCNDGTTRKYFRANAAVAKYDALIWDTTAAINYVIPSAAADIPIVGIAPIAVTTQYYFWAIIGGKAHVKVAAAVVAGAPLVPIATAGTLDDTAASAANALAMAAGIGVICIQDDINELDAVAAGIARVYVSQ